MTTCSDHEQLAQEIYDIAEHAADKMDRILWDTRQLVPKHLAIMVDFRAIFKLSLILTGSLIAMAEFLNGAESPRKLDADEVIDAHKIFLLTLYSMSQHEDEEMSFSDGLEASQALFKTIEGRENRFVSLSAMLR